MISLGSLNEVYSDIEKWEEFTEYLSNLSEGEDSMGRELNMKRYSSWLEGFTKIAQEESDAKKFDLILEMEEYLDREIGLKCLDSGLRKEVVRNINAVKEGSMQPGTDVFGVMYERVLERLRELLGNYQSLKLTENKVGEKESSPVI